MNTTIVIKSSIILIDIIELNAFFVLLIFNLTEAALAQAVGRCQYSGYTYISEYTCKSYT